MLALILSLAILLQGGTTLESANGSISGVLKTASGAPAAGARVAAMALPESAATAMNSTAMVSLAATDELGRFRLENIPPGRYYIAAGRVDFPTYFPGALDRTAGAIISVEAKANISGVNFALQDVSVRIQGNDVYLLGAQLLPVPVRVVVDGGGKQPVSANGNFLMLTLTRLDGLREQTRLDAPALVASLATAVVGAEYRAAVDNIPAGYALPALTYGSTELMRDTLKLNAASFLQSSNNLPAGANTITVTLRPAPPAGPPPAGFRITGQAPARGSWTVYRDDVPGTFFADGSFELLGVPPGRHVIVLQDTSSTPRFYAALADVIDRDVSGVVLDSTELLPKSIPATALAVTNTASKSLAGLTGRVVEAEGGTPVPRGIVTFMGKTMFTISLGTDGTFAIPHLLPGSYDLRAEVYEHFTLYETVVIGDQDIQLNLAVRSNQLTEAEREINNR